MTTIGEDPNRNATLTQTDAHSSTPTLTPQPETTNANGLDQEKQQAGPPAMPGAPFPDGGLKAWSAVAGAWLFGRSTSFTSR